MKKLFANEKIDLLYSIILVLIWIIFLLISKLLHFHSEWVISFIGVFVIACFNLPTILRRKKQYKKIDELRKVLNLSIEEVREIADIGRYDLSDWNWDKAYISSKKLYLLEDTLEKMYVKQFGKEFEMRK
ncbi:MULTISPECIES: hypothetical protein [Lactobacillales]|jgi:hypothetical protein|uniref:hypothetical protein n=1 Tax=Lactobacillales TaxID=186826 RepID=UPI00019CF464|nr:MULTISPECIES: hypothetical protein [Lactobacillales]EAC8808334.1 hypothetical protein [Listeria monocytogenes]AYY11336.1 hypothetical protein EGX73_15945 [Enterococcus sp. FDAARGOS_553]MBS0673278.1 hypothetical protein [Enterococcus faecalis]MBS0681628.1 hypothetical protein [Enterococcus faecalis]MCM6932480.1 hypothetical protein [Enterococcus italicus]